MEEQNQNATQPIILATPPKPVWFYYLLSFLIFPIGWFLGLIYFRKTGYDNKNFAMTCTLLGFSVPVLLIVIFFISLAVRKI